MLVGIEAQSTVGEKTGIGVYASNILKFFGKNTIHRYLLYQNPRWRKTNTFQRIIWENIRLPLLLLRTKPDVFFVPGFSPPLIKLRKTVVVVHDLIGVIFPQNLGFFSRIYWSRWLPFCVRGADYIICDSENTKKDCLNILKVKEEKIKVIYPGIENNLPISPQDSDKDVLKKFNIRDRFILSLSTIEPRKNFPRLVEAWAKVKREFREDVLLVIAGRKDWGWRQLRDKVDTLAIRGSLIITGYITEKEKAVLYRNCEFFVFPSLYEGFGLPVLEAMSFRKAVISSNASSLPEITADSAILVNPKDVDSLVDAIFQLLRDSHLRETLAEKGYQRSKLFSWEKTATEILRVFEDISKN